MLSAEQLEFRKKGLGGSDATRIMRGDWHTLWLEKTGRSTSEDLSNVLPVQLGSWTEEFNRQWFQRQTEITVVTGGCENLVHPEHDWMRANTDGFTADLSPTEDPDEFTAAKTGIFEAKHVNQFKTLEECVSDYYAQMHHYMMVTGFYKCTLSVLFGNLRWEYHTVEFDPDYADQLMQMEQAFWQHVIDDEEPVNPAAEKKKVRLDGMKVRSYAKSKGWSKAAATWTKNRSAVSEFKGAEKELKSMVGDDVRTAFGDGIYINKSKTGSLTIRELNEHKEADFLEDMDDEFEE